MPNLYNNADIYVSTSISDGASVSLFEAMACGKPVVVADNLGNREWIDERDNGLFFNVGDYEDLAEKLLYSLDDYEMRKRQSFPYRSTAPQFLSDQHGRSEREQRGRSCCYKHGPCPLS